MTTNNANFIENKKEMYLYKSLISVKKVFEIMTFWTIYMSINNAWYLPKSPHELIALPKLFSAVIRLSSYRV